MNKTKVDGIGPKWTESDENGLNRTTVDLIKMNGIEQDQSRQNTNMTKVNQIGLNKTKVDQIGLKGLNRTRMDQSILNKTNVDKMDGIRPKQIEQD